MAIRAFFIRQIQKKTLLAVFDANPVAYKFIVSGASETLFRWRSTARSTTFMAYRAYFGSVRFKNEMGRVGAWVWTQVVEVKYFWLNTLIAFICRLSKAGETCFVALFALLSNLWEVLVCLWAVWEIALKLALAWSQLVAVITLCALINSEIVACITVVRTFLTDSLAVWEPPYSKAGTVNSAVKFVEFLPAHTSQAGFCLVIRPTFLATQLNTWNTRFWLIIFGKSFRTVSYTGVAREQEEKFGTLCAVSCWARCALRTTSRTL